MARKIDYRFGNRYEFRPGKGGSYTQIGGENNPQPEPYQPKKRAKVIGEQEGRMRAVPRLRSHNTARFIMRKRNGRDVFDLE